MDTGSLAGFCVESMFHPVSNPHCLTIRHCVTSNAPSFSRDARYDELCGGIHCKSPRPRRKSSRKLTRLLLGL